MRSPRSFGRVVGGIACGIGGDGLICAMVVGALVWCVACLFLFLLGGATEFHHGFLCCILLYLRLEQLYSLKPIQNDIL
jgi:hypothetical protein